MVYSGPVIPLTVREEEKKNKIHMNKLKKDYFILIKKADKKTER